MGKSYTEVHFNAEDLQELNDARIAIEQAIIARLNKAGIYYRSFSRVKSEDSLNKKIEKGRYEGERKIQDLLGIRINLFYYEDINICEKILNDTFQSLNWSKSKNQENEFHAQKRNGVFVLPARYARNISSDLWDKPIDQTFEVQLRTLLFEGWHEIEHDMRYKFKKSEDVSAEFWDGQNKMSRIMNSIIANLELCDWSIVQIFDNMADNQIDDKNWEYALRSKYRLKMNDDDLKEDLDSYFDENPEAALPFFDISKQELVDVLLREKVVKEISPNRIFYLLNKNIVHDINVHQLLMNETFEPIRRREQIAELHPLKSDRVFNQEVYIRPEAFDTASSIIYDWAYERIHEVFNQMPKNIDRLRYESIGYKIVIDYDPHAGYFYMDMQHLSSIEAGAIWHTKAEICRIEKGTVLRVENICEAFTSRVRHYSRPRFMRDIYRRVGFIDADRAIGRHEDRESEFSFDELISLVKHPERKLSIIAAIKNSEEYDWSTDFAGYIIDYEKVERDLAGISHVVTVSNECMNMIYPAVEDNDKKAAVLYWKKGKSSVQVFTAEEVKNCRFEEVYQSQGISEYEKAFRYQLKELIKDEFKE